MTATRSLLYTASRGLEFRRENAPKHTPEPWRTARDLLFDVWAGEWTPVSPRFVIAEQVRGHSDEEIEANANLIAAAPELLAALTKIVSLRDGGWEDTDIVMRKAFEAARAAIANAEGRP